MFISSHVELTIRVILLERESDMIRCCNSECILGAWFHSECVGIDELPESTVDWYCSTECKDMATADSVSDTMPTPDGEMDFVRNYAVSVVWNGLLDSAHRDAIREADGIMMMSL